MSADAELAEKNARTARRVGLVLVVMAIVPWAYSPLYRRVCGVLGVAIPGETKRAAAVMPTDRKPAGKRVVSLVHFMGASGQLPIDITPRESMAWIPVGETSTMVYRLHNRSSKDLDYRAIHMLYPAGDPAFLLVKCFCDDHRIIKAGVTEDWPLVFQLVKPVASTMGLTVNYTLFDYRANTRHATLLPLGT